MLKTIFRNVATAAVCLTILTACDNSATEKASIEKARAHIEEGDGSAAIIELKNALQANPDSADARALLGELYLRAADAAGAAKELERAVELGRNETSIRVLLAQAQVQVGEYQKVVDEIPADMPIANDDDAELLAVRGQALFGLGQFDEAKATLEDTVAKHPTASGYVGLARMALFSDDAAAADQYLDEGEAKFPDNHWIKLLRGEQLLQAREFEAAQKMFEDLSKADPNDLAAGMGLARAELTLGRFESAQVVIEDMMGHDPKNLALYMLRAVASLQGRDYTAAQQDANSVLAVEKNNPAALYVAGAAAYGLKQYEQAHANLSRYVAAAPGDLNGRKLLAATQVQMGDPEGARSTLGDAANIDDPAYLSLLSTAATLTGDPSAGLQYIERAVLQSPEDARLRAQLGIMRIATGDSAQGQADLDQALGIDPTLADDPRYDRAEIALIQSLMTEGKFDEALELIRKWQEDHPDNEIGLVMEGVAYAGSGDTQKAREAFRKAMEKNPGSTNAAANLAVLELRENDPAAAELALQQALEHNPEDLRTLVLLAQLAERKGERDKTRSYLEKAVAAHPDSMPTRIVLARLYFELNEPEKSLTTIGPVVREMPANIPAREVKARAELRTGDIRGAITTYQSIVAQAPEAVQSHYELSQAYAINGQPEEALESAEAAVKIDPNHSAARLQVARMALQIGDAAKAEPAIVALEEVYPDAAEIKQLRGQYLLLTGDAKGALALFQEVRKTLNVSSVVVYEARAQGASGDVAAATSTLEQWIADNPNDTPARLELNRYYAQAGRQDDAKANLETIIGYQPDSAVARNDLAWLLHEKGDYAAARPHAERANELAPDNPAIMDTLGVILLEMGETDKATGLLRRAHEAIPDNPDIGFHLAQAYVKGEHKDEARKLLAALLEKHPTFSDRDGAAALLAEIGG